MPRYDTIQYPDLKTARDQLRTERRCINGPRDPSTNVGINGVVHGPVVKSGKCQRCVDVAYGKAKREGSLTLYEVLRDASGSP